jgi:HAD superfamily hydrolase (TIGR01509 family)
LPHKLQAIFFDFNGVIVDDEPVHFLLFQKVLREEGLRLEEKDYYEIYIGMDDYGCFRAVLERHHAPVTEERIQGLIARKATYYEGEMRSGIRFFPGASDLIRQAAARCYVGLVSGALRSEIVAILESAGLLGCFRVLVSATDMQNGKPDPEGYLTALRLLNERVSSPVSPSDCLVIEDSVAGIQAAHSAGMSCIAVTNSHPAGLLRDADLVVSTLEGLSWEKIASVAENGSW